MIEADKSYHWYGCKMDKFTKKQLLEYQRLSKDVGIISNEE